MRTGKRILIIDQLNLFFRNYIVNPSLSLDGAPIGALKGCFQSLQKVIRESKPDMVIVCWDGEGGSTKRKLLKKDYKAGRKPIRLNRSIRNLSKEEEKENNLWQQSRLVDYFNQTPIIQFMFKGTEADDIIAYICQHKIFADCEKIILSSDKDFFQLLDEKTVLYRPVQKQIVNQKSLIEQFNVHPINFAMARAFAGDKSDNIEGLGGIGLKTAAKRFPFLKEREFVTFDKILNYCQKMMAETNIRIYNDVVEKKDLLKRNYHMMQLYTPILGIDEKRVINETLQGPDTSFNKTELIKMMMVDGFGEINFVDLFQHFRKMSIDHA